MRVEQLAQICHEANKAYCESIGDFSQKHWAEAEQWQRDSAIRGVCFAISNPDAKASCQHDAWLKDKIDNGWKYGPVKDASKKEHPCVVSYEELPLKERLKDSLFKGIVSSLTAKE